MFCRALYLPVGVFTLYKFDIYALRVMGIPILTNFLLQLGREVRKIPVATLLGVTIDHRFPHHNPSPPPLPLTSPRPQQRPNPLPNLLRPARTRPAPRLPLCADYFFLYCPIPHRSALRRPLGTDERRAVGGGWRMMGGGWWVVGGGRQEADG